MVSNFGALASMIGDLWLDITAPLGSRIPDPLVRNYGAVSSPLSDPLARNYGAVGYRIPDPLVRN